MQIDLLDSACELSGADWQRLATGGDPFISRAFLGAAEETGAAGTALAWQALHLALRDDAGRLAGLLPLYLREHSFGDFSRDWNWAPAWRQTGREYYPKLVSGVPYTPSPGPRLLACAGADASVAPALIDAARRLAGELRTSSWQCLFVREADRRLLEAAGLLSVDPQWITIHPRGRFLVRAIAMVFDRYLHTAQQHARYSKVI
ncbi:MAG: hypothetical protein CVU20_13080 [Betaproteobacteria bacterium HGW-Betaproteobacteria-14]|nr:MAG: hypothetical protein CVU20_13080 [Betaproteobacteria bacterium HGW-Betaproteobacteria-14]